MAPPSVATRRNALIGIERPQHAGLWLDRYVSELGEQGAGKKRVLDHALGVPTPKLYRTHFKVWKEALQAEGALLALGHCVSASTAPDADPGKAAQESPGRLLVGLGAESVLETAITLHRTYGVPYIPGSALKGVAASFARHSLADPMWCPGKDPKSGRAHQAVFGTQDQAGCVTFLDALYDPASTMGPLVEDVLTVHHPGYYQDDKNPSPPADWDSPNPIPFVTATGRFLIALLGPPLWVDRAYDILRLALLHEGVGAKTTRGYGRLLLSRLEEKSKATGSGAVVGSEDFQSVARVRALKQGEVKGGVGQFLQHWKSLPEGPEKRALAQAIVERVEAIRWTEKAWYSDLRDYLQG